MPSVSVFVLVAALFVFNASLQQSQYPQSNPSTSNPAGAQQPQGSQQQHDPQAAAPAPQTDSGANQRIQSSLDDLLSSDQVLSGADVEVKVDDRDITLSGTVESYAQHQRALQLAAQYGRWRHIVDKIQLK
jgi:osmotically-inducible protein OsmY